MQASVGAALANIAALSLATDYPTLASLPHSVINGYKNVLAIAVETDYSFPLAEKVRRFEQQVCCLTGYSYCQSTLLSLVWLHQEAARQAADSACQCFGTLSSSPSSSCCLGTHHH
jgi:hypothetical protein